jgi:hypothetical protein
LTPLVTLTGVKLTPRLSSAADTERIAGALTRGVVQPIATRSSRRISMEFAASGIHREGLQALAAIAMYAGRRVTANVSRVLLKTHSPDVEPHMIEMNHPHSVRSGRTWPRVRPCTTPLELWRFHGAKSDVRGLVIKTSFGYGLRIELGGELLLQFLLPSLEQLIEEADRFEAGLRHIGWREQRDVGDATSVGQESA